MFQLLFSASILLAGQPSLTDTTLLGRFVIPAEGDTYGGFSAIHISNDGGEMIAVSDREGFVTGTISRNASGNIIDITTSKMQAINGYDPNPPFGVEDAEGIAVANDGTIYVSFEKDHRVGAFASPTAREQTIPKVPIFEPVSDNGSFEALAIDSDGALYVIPERTRRRRDPFPILRFQDGEWDQPFFLPRNHPYFVTGADFGPQGRLYVLERHFSGYGFYSRVRRIDFETATAETILDTRFGTHGNLEGISIWENQQGETIMTLIADNNFRLFLSNEIAEYRIDG